MGIVALVLLSVSLAWTAVFGGLNPADPSHSRTWYPWNAGGRVLSRLHAYQPPARKSVVVDISGMAHPTADNTSMTKRDRSRLYPYLEMNVAPKEEDLPSIPQDAAPTQAFLSTPLPAPLAKPLFQAQIEEAPLAPPAVPSGAMLRPAVGPSLGRKVQMALLADSGLSKSARSTLSIMSLRNKVTLRGIVMDVKEKRAIGDKAEQIAGDGNVDNRLTVL